MGRLRKTRSRNLASLAAFAWLAFTAADADGKVVKIGQRNGGEILLHISQATYMMSTGNSYRVVADQYSAAAMQVLFIESQYPDRICASPRAKLHFHLAFDPATKTNMKEPNWAFTAFIRPDNLKRLGPLPEYGHGFKTVRAIDYLGRCKTKTTACNVAGCGQ